MERNEASFDSDSEDARSRPKRRRIRDSQQQRENQQSLEQKLGGPIVDLTEEDCGINGIDDDKNMENHLDEAFNVTAEAGIVKRIVVKNWMCHKHFTVNLESGTNFITGRNGSGKSALLAALTVGLGAKAGSTGRGDKVAGLIRREANAADIYITLKNDGAEAYKPQEYGNSITIHRHITKNGSTSYKVLDEQKRVVSDKKAEVDRIIDHFGIQVDNPVAILTQETAKQFLLKPSPSRNYELFMKATQLEQMRRDYNDIFDHLNSMEASLKRKEAFVASLKRTVDDLKREVDELQEVETLKEKKMLLKQQLAWSHVEVAEKEYEALLQKIAQAEKHAAKYKTEIEQLEQAKAEVEAENQEKLNEANSFTQSVAAVRAEIDAIERRIQEAQREMRVIDGKIAGERKKRDGIVNRKLRVEKKIEESRNQVLADTQEAVSTIERDISRREEALREVRENIQRLMKEEEEIETALQAKDEEIKRVEDVLQAKLQLKRKTDDELKKLMDSKSDRFNAFGRRTREIVEHLQKEHIKRLFETPVLGPIGSLVRLSNSKWAVAVESCCGAVLNAYVVNSTKDEDAFKNVLRNLGFKNHEMPPIIVQRILGRPFNIPPNQLPESCYTTILSILQSDHPDVINVLINQCKIESRILIENEAEAERVVREVRPRNVSEVFLPDGARLFLRTTTFIKRPAEGRAQGRIGGANVEEQIAKLKTNSERIAAELNQLHERKKTLQTEKTIISQRRASRTDLAQNKRREVELQQEINSLKRKMEEVESSQPTDVLEELEQNLRKLENDIAAIDNVIAQYEKEKEQIRQRLPPLQEELKRKHEAAEFDLDKSKQLESDLKMLSDKLSQINGKIKAHNRALAGVKEELERLYRTQRDSLNRLENKKTLASEVCPRPSEPIGQQPTSIIKEIEAIVRRIDDVERGRVRSYAQVENAYQAAKSNYEKAEAAVEHLKLLHSGLVERNKLRMRKWVKLRKHLALRADGYFRAYLSQKGYSGKLSFDFSQNTLEISVNVNRNASDTAGIGNLSGGERSYATVSLLLSLWDVIECPFRAMDEFDVFMDLKNRKIAIDLLVRAGQQRKTRQYIYLTPNDLPPLDDSVHVLRLATPERNQRTLDEMYGE